jgi:hypothetical protein
MIGMHVRDDDRCGIEGRDRREPVLAAIDQHRAPPGDDLERAVPPVPAARSSM